MKILVLADKTTEAEFSLKFTKHPYIFIQEPAELDIWLGQADIIFDLKLHEEPERLKRYQAQGRQELAVFCDGVQVQLAALQRQNGPFSFHLFGINTLPTLLNRPVLEVSALHKSSADKLQELCQRLGTEYVLVEDRVGMVTPRIILMIINEACYTLQEGTASVPDIDQGMKLGTNYPHGPFEWADKIGVNNVYEVLQAIYDDTKDERYKICPLLKTKYLKGENFLSVAE